MVDTTALRAPSPLSTGIFFDPAPSRSATAATSLTPRRHLLGLEGLPAEHLLELLESARQWRQRWSLGRVPRDTLAGVEVCNAFFEDSTRTRLSFELAERRLGATPLSFGIAGSSCSKGESLLDTLHTIAAMGIDVLVMRHPAAGAALCASRELGVSVVNAGDGAHEHPTQGLLDLMTLSDAWDGEFAGRRLAIIGDVAHSRVARSACFGLATLGASVTVAGPATLLPHDVEALGCDVAPSPEDALRDADAAIVLRLQTERMEQGLLPSLAEYAQVWGINMARAELMKPRAVLLHPGPMNRGVEITCEVADAERSRVLAQVENGVAVRAAVLAWCAGREVA